MELSRLPEPAAELTAVVVVPARDEEELIGRCIRALCRQQELEARSWEILLTLDGCTDATSERAREAASAWPWVVLHELVVEGLGAGVARAAGMDLACRRLQLTGRTDGLIATTDADSEVAPDWIVRQLEATARGAAAIGGRITLEDAGSDRLGAETIARRNSAHRARLEKVSGDGPTDHPFFGGASIGITAQAYRDIGGMEPLAALEDESLARRLSSGGFEIHRLDSVRVSTSARTDGRAERGLARDLTVSEWSRRRTWEADDFPLERLLEAKRGPISLVLPAAEVAGTIGEIVSEVMPLRDAGLLDEVLVVDADSADGTAEIAAAAGATVVQESHLLPAFGACRGKGDAMWRAASFARGDTLVFCDADSRDFHAGFVLGLLGPILTEDAVRLVKGSFERPFLMEDRAVPNEGGRVTELVARPLINLYFFDLAAVEQPLAGEIAIDRSLFEQLPVPVGYGVEIAMIVDCLELAGLEAIAQTRLGTRQNRHQSLRALTRMAYEVSFAAHRRIGGGESASAGPLLMPGRSPERLEPRCEERPPLRELAVDRSVGDDGAHQGAVALGT